MEPPHDEREQRRPAPPRQARPTDARYEGPARRGAADRPVPPARRRRLGAKTAVAVVSLLVLSLTGYAWAAMQGLVNGLTTTDVISKDQPPDGARDILLVGMDSRTDAQGNPLPEQLLAQLRAGVSDGEENTDTLILVHIPSNGGKAVAMSLPRDSYVNIPGFGMHKINSAYARGKAAERKKLQDSGGNDAKQIELQSSQAGAKTLIATVEQLTGIGIDNYASINLLGFADITQAIGGVDVCLKDNVNDPYSGAKFTAGRHTISGVEALEFVRQRHGLPRGDLDRVVRQQVFMAGMAQKVLSAGTLTDPSKLAGLTDAIKKSVVLNQGWDIVAFAQQMKGLSGGQLQFQTIPIENMDYDTPEDGQAIEVDPGQVGQFVQGLTGAPAAAPAPTVSPNAATTVDVHNGTSKEGLAATVSQALAGKGFTAGETKNATGRIATTTVRYPAGAKTAAQTVADSLGSKATLTEDDTVQSGHVLVVVGSSYSGSATPAGAAQAVAPAPSSVNPAAADDDKPITADGVTCVN